MQKFRRRTLTNDRIANGLAEFTSVFELVEGSANYVGHSAYVAPLAGGAIGSLDEPPSAGLLERKGRG